MKKYRNLYTIFQYLNYSIKYYLLPFLCLPIRLIATYIPKDENLYIFGSWLGRNFSDNPRCFYDYLREKKIKKRLVILIKNKQKYIELLKRGHEVYLAYSLKGLLVAARASICFITHSVQEDLNMCTLTKKIRLIQLWHGTHIKKIKRFSATINNKLFHLLLNFIDKISHYNFPEIELVLVASKPLAKQTADFFGVNLDKVKVLGYPRNDVFFKKSKKNILRRYKGFKKYILFAPTYRGGNDDLRFFTDKFLSKLDNYLKKNNYLFIIKLHPSLEEKQPDRKYKNIISASLLNGLDTQDILSVADALIVDYSSIMIDFALMDKPIIFYPFDYENYVKSVGGLRCNYYQDLPGPFAKNEDQLFDLIQKVDIWFKNKEYQEKYKKFKNKFNYYQDGNSSRRLYKFLVEKND